MKKKCKLKPKTNIILYMIDNINNIGTYDVCCLNTNITIK